MAQSRLRTALQAYDQDYALIREMVLDTFRQLAADSARRLHATQQPVAPDFEDAVVREVGLSGVRRCSRGISSV